MACKQNQRISYKRKREKGRSKIYNKPNIEIISIMDRRDNNSESDFSQ